MDLDLLPQSARDIVSTLGVCDAITVLSALAGTRWEVPLYERRHNKAGAQLVRYLGEPLAMRFIMAFGGETLIVPRCQKALNGVRDAAITTRFETLCREGVTVRLAMADLALQYRLTTVSIGKIVNRVTQPKPDDNQLPLF